jgi:hypothetical protein
MQCHGASSAFGLPERILKFWKLTLLLVFAKWCSCSKFVISAHKSSKGRVSKRKSVKGEKDRRKSWKERSYWGRQAACVFSEPLLLVWWWEISWWVCAIDWKRESYHFVLAFCNLSAVMMINQVPSFVYSWHWEGIEGLMRLLMGKG